jgi:hypothetical protein
MLDIPTFADPTVDNSPIDIFDFTENGIAMVKMSRTDLTRMLRELTIVPNITVRKEN